MLKMILLLLPLTVANAYAQISSTPLSQPPPSAVPIQRSIGLSLEVPGLEFGLTNKLNDKHVDFKPNEKINWGLDASYDGYKLGFSIPVTQDAESIEQKGKTEHFDLYLGHYWDSFGIDGFYQTYKGLYVDETQGEGSTFPKRPDLKSHLYGVNLYYAFSPNRFPLRSLSSFDGQGEERGGSWIAFATASDFSLRGDIPLTSSYQMLGARLRTAAVGAGYGARWTRNGYILNGFMLFGAGPQAQSLTFTTSNRTANKIGQAILLNGSFAYRFDDWTTGFMLKFNSYPTELGDDQKLAVNGFSFKIFGTRAF